LCYPINLLFGASPDFIAAVEKIELEIDYDKRSQIAIDYIDKNNGLKEILYVTLGEYLKNPYSISTNIWRQLYLLERSIKPRFGDHYTWYQRLKVFYDTYCHETNVHGKIKINGHPVLLRKGSKTNPIYHDRLVYGKGKFGADFYYFDEALPGNTTIEKMVDVEFKYSQNLSAEEVALKYLDNKYMYDAKYLITFVNRFNCYYLIDYTKFTKAELISDCTMKLNLTTPSNLIDV
jgi:hypothetical protein